MLIGLYGLNRFLLKFGGVWESFGLGWLTRSFNKIISTQRNTVTPNIKIRETCEARIQYETMTQQILKN